MRVASFATLLRANAGPTRVLNERLVTDFGLTIEDYEVLLRLARTPELRMREIDLAAQPLLTAAKTTRVLDQLERRRLVDRDHKVEEHVVYVTLTDAGRAKTQAATADHAAQVEELFGSLLEDDESLEALLVRLTDEPS